MVIGIARMSESIRYAANLERIEACLYPGSEGDRTEPQFEQKFSLDKDGFPHLGQFMAL
jgi:hypothetical protein